MNMMNSCSIMERPLDAKHFENVQESWSSAAKFCYKSSLEITKMETCRKSLTEKSSIFELGHPENLYLSSVRAITYVASIAFIVVSLLIISSYIYKNINYQLNVFREPLRNYIPIRVNCWFCNKNGWVPFPRWEMWTCAACKQYNGFNEDGDYNQPIEAQFIESLNSPIRGRPAEGYNLESGSNGLCNPCNFNQVKKVFYLSSFTAVNEQNYDAEIEAEEKRLEKVCGICPSCKDVVEEALKRTLDKAKNMSFQMRPLVRPAVLQYIEFNNYN